MTTSLWWHRIASLGKNYSGNRTDLLVQIGTVAGQINRDINLKQHVRMFRDVTSTEFKLMDYVSRPHRPSFASECHQLEEMTSME
ncbi:hypothetical protein TNCV_3641461 [Trichonephila clavipes]|nr:hypothetical protein TNCV_3641461 [Trichonephila clavipes]